MSENKEPRVGREYLAGDRYVVEVIGHGEIEGAPAGRFVWRADFSYPYPDRNRPGTLARMEFGAEPCSMTHQERDLVMSAIESSYSHLAGFIVISYAPEGGVQAGELRVFNGDLAWSRDGGRT